MLALRAAAVLRSRGGCTTLNPASRYAHVSRWALRSHENPSTQLSLRRFATTNTSRISSSGSGGGKQGLDVVKTTVVDTAGQGVKAGESKANETLWERIQRYTRPPESARKSTKSNQPRDLKRSLQHCLDLAWPHRMRLLRAGGFLIISSASMMALPWAVGQMVDIMNADDSEKRLWQLYGFLIPVFVGGAIAGFLRARELVIVGESITRTLRQRLFRSIMEKPTGFFDHHKTGDLVSRLSNDTNNLGHTMSERLAGGARAFVQGAGGLGYMLYMSPTLTGYMLLTVAPIMLAVFSYGRVVKRLAEAIQTSLGASSTLAAERLANIRTVRVFGQEKQETKAYNKEVTDIYEAGRYQGILQGAMVTIFPMIGNFGVIFIMHQGAGLVHADVMTTGDLISFITYSAWLGISIRNLTQFFTETVRSLGASERAFDILDLPANQWPGTYIPTQPKGHYSLSNISFAYPTRSHTPVLTDCTLDITPGQTVAIVGESGSGKSTIAHLLTGLYEPSEGQVLMDGRPIKEYDRDMYLSKIGVVSQEPVLFSGTVATNIRYGSPEGTISDADMHSAARKASAHQFIMSLPDGYNTIIGERGYTLSGGQKQRLAIARALARRPLLLILDEATSALDSESEHLVQVAMHDMMQADSEQTMVVIAHRLSTIQNADIIAVVHQGAIAELGTFDDLLERNGVFANLVRHQYSVRNVDPRKMDLKTDTYV